MDRINFKRINHSKLNARQQESFNFQKVSAALADFGYSTMKLSDDWAGADFIAIHFKNKPILKIQLKGSITFSTKYLYKDLFICFEDKRTSTWYLFPHGKLCEKFSFNFTKSNC